MAPPHGLLAWADVAVPDMEAAADFYGAVFGWKAQEVVPTYSYFMLDGRKVAGMGK